LSRKTKTLRKAVEDLVGRQHQPTFSLLDALVEFGALLRRQPIVEGRRKSSLVKLLGDLALVRGIEGFEQFDDLRLGLGHVQKISRPAASRD
jgi:hypothetical protein